MDEKSMGCRKMKEDRRGVIETTFGEVLAWKRTSSISRFYRRRFVSLVGVQLPVYEHCVGIGDG